MPLGVKRMNIMGFAASPRKDGNTAWAVNKILEGAKEHGADTDVWCSGDLEINACRGCLCCVKSGKCVINDDMQHIYTALERADALVLGSPVYMGQMSAQAKIFTDRLFAQISPRFSPKFREENAGKKLVLVFTQGNPDPDMFRTYFDYTKRMFELLEFDVEAVHIIAGTRNGPADERTDLPAVLREIGSALVRSAQ